MSKFKLGAAGVALALFSAPAFAADVPAPAPSLNNTATFEISPEYKPDTSFTDYYFKLGLSHTFSNNFVVGGTYQFTNRIDLSSASQVEASLGYKIKSGPFTLTPSVYLGYGFGDQPQINGGATLAAKQEADLYYAVTLAADYKLDDHWTWNVFNARYRNAFNTTWITPKISSGITYKIDAADSVYFNVGYAWKDKGLGAGLLEDKWNVAVGYKLSF